MSSSKEQFEPSTKLTSTPIVEQNRRLRRLDKIEYFPKTRSHSVDNPNKNLKLSDKQAQLILGNKLSVALSKKLVGTATTSTQVSKEVASPFKSDFATNIFNQSVANIADQQRTEQSLIRAYGLETENLNTQPRNLFNNSQKAISEEHIYEEPINDNNMQNNMADIGVKDFLSGIREYRGDERARIFHQ